MSLAGSSASPVNPPLSADANRVRQQGFKLYAGGRYFEARELFQQGATMAQSAGDNRIAAAGWNNVGACWLAEMQFRPALEAFNRARALAEQTGDVKVLAASLNNLASLYVHMGEPEQAMRAVQAAMRGPNRDIALDQRLRPQLRLQLATALIELHRYDDALPIYTGAISELISQKNYSDAVRSLTSLGDASLGANRLDRAEAALTTAMRLVRENKADGLASTLSGTARLRARQGHFEEARALFDQSLTVAPGRAPRWKLTLERAQFYLGRGELPAAVADFRTARALAARLRLDVVPADQDRVGLERGLSEIVEGLVEAGNRLASKTGDITLVQETFDAAEQDRQWSLRALVPGIDDWRSRLPENYWDLLIRYQGLERAAVAQPGPEIERKVAQADDELKRIEVQAGQAPAQESAGSPLQHARGIIDAHTALFSFHVGARTSWLWATDREGTQTFALPGASELERQSEAFKQSVREGSRDARDAGAALYSTLFAAVPSRFTSRTKWLLEPDGPLYEVPFAALVVNGNTGAPEYLIEKASLQSIPGALLLEKPAAPLNGALLAVGDAIYNAADPRYGTPNRQVVPALPRLPNTAEELAACRRAWGAERTRLLLGGEATPESLRSELRNEPAIIHFATHVVPSAREFRTGLIALSPGNDGSMGVMGPREIVARPVHTALVVMDGCHSLQALALPGAGLMGLTRAWIGAGAAAVLATQWDIPDQDSQSLMEAFYRELAATPWQGVAAALRNAQLAQLQRAEGRENPGRWAGYLLQSRAQ